MIIVTGGAGFIGSNIIARLRDENLSPIVVCDIPGTDATTPNLAKAELADVLTQETLAPFIEENGTEIEAIFHMGAISATTEMDVDLITRTNVDWSRQLWDLSAKHSIKFFYASSAATYGEGENGFQDFFTPEELATLQPLNPYGRSKHQFDQMVRDLIDQGAPVPPQWAGLKFFNVYGPNEYHKGSMLSVAYQLYHQIKETGQAKLFESYKNGVAHGDQARDFVWVRDCINIMMWLYRTPTVSGLFNIGSGQGRTFNELAKAAFAALGVPENITYIPMPETLRDKYQYYTQADMQKLKTAGYDIPLTSIEAGVQQYFDQYLSQQDRYA